MDFSGQYDYLLSSLTEQSIMMSWFNTNTTGIYSTEYFKQTVISPPNQTSSFFTKCTE